MNASLSGAEIAINVGNPRLQSSSSKCLRVLRSISDGVGSPAGWECHVPRRGKRLCVRRKKAFSKPVSPYRPSWSAVEELSVPGGSEDTANTYISRACSSNAP